MVRTERTDELLDRYRMAYDEMKYYAENDVLHGNEILAWEDIDSIMFLLENGGN